MPRSCHIPCDIPGQLSDLAICLSPHIVTANRQQLPSLPHITKLTQSWRFLFQDIRKIQPILSTQVLVQFLVISNLDYRISILRTLYCLWVVLTGIGFGLVPLCNIKQYFKIYSVAKSTVQTVTDPGIGHIRSHVGGGIGCHTFRHRSSFTQENSFFSLWYISPFCQPSHLCYAVVCLFMKSHLLEVSNVGWMIF